MIAALLWLLYTLGDILTPSVIAVVLAYVLNPLVKWLRFKHFRRGTASMMMMVLTLLVLLALTLVIVSMLISRFNDLVA